MTKRAYNVRCKDKEYQSQMEDDFEVKMERCDEEFFENNCFGSYTFTCSNTVAKDWERRRKRKIKRELSSSKKKLKVKQDQEEQVEINN